MPAIPPNTTLYLKNLDTKVKKQELRRQLYVLFNAYGKVIDIVATRADGMRGQAFVVFRDLQSSTAALRALDGFEFYDRPMSITYAKTKSKATIVLEKGPEALFDPTILASYQAQSAPADSAMTNGEPSKPSLGKVTYSSAQTELKGRERKRAREDEANKGGRAARDDDDESEGEDMEVGSDDDDEEDGQPKKIARIDKEEGGEDAQASKEVQDEMDMASSSSDEAEPSFGPPEAKSGTVPNPILFLPSLAASVTDEALTSFFSGHEGFQSVELHAAPPAAGTRRSSRKSNASAATGHAFATFDSTQAAGKAKDALDGKEIGEGDEAVTVDVLWAFRG